MSMAGRQKKTQSSTSWRPIINGTKANVVGLLEKHTIKHKKTYKQRESSSDEYLAHVSVVTIGMITTQCMP